MSEKSQPFSSICDVTEIKSKDFIYTWRVLNFKHLSKGAIEDDVMYAPITDRYNAKENESEAEDSAADEHPVKNNEELWVIYLYPYGRPPRVKESENFVSVEVTFLGNPELENIITYYLSICIVDINGKECEIYTLDNAEKGTEITLDTLIRKDFLMDEKNGLLPDGDLTLRFKAYVSYKIINHPLLSYPASCLNTQMLVGFDDILDVKKFSDVKVQVDDKIFHVYKGILASRSPVFKAMFEHDMEENIENVVKIPDINYEIMQEVFQFMYTGKVNNIKDLAKDLLVAADKYQVEELKVLCEAELIKNLNAENVTSLLIHAAKFEAKNLKSIALEFFKLHAKEVIKNEKYKEDLKSLLPVIPDIFEIDKCLWLVLLFSLIKFKEDDKEE